MVLEGRDVWMRAPTGSGKTAAYVLPLLDRLNVLTTNSTTGRAVRALIVVPSRELAVQVANVIERCGGGGRRRVRLVTAIGGVSINPQMLALRGGADVLVGTPGRLLDLIDKNALRLAGLEALVLDEADRLLSAGFAEELQRLLPLLPQARQTVMVSATFPLAVQTLVASLLKSPARIEVANDSDAETDAPAAAITQRAIAVDEGKRTLLLRHLLEAHGWDQVLVFVASRHGADHVSMKLNRVGIAAEALHGDLSQSARTGALEDFKSKRFRVLIATDVASRGVDIPQLPVVVSYDLPRSPTDFVHRIGRTGRAGHEGVAVSFVTPQSEAHFRLIERRNKWKLPREVVAGFESTDEAPTQDPNGGIKGKRKSKKDKLREAAALAATKKNG